MVALDCNVMTLLDGCWKGLLTCKTSWKLMVDQQLLHQMLK